MSSIRDDLVALDTNELKVIAARLEASQVRYFISENRLFLAELSGLPFDVLTSEAAIRLLNE